MDTLVIIPTFNESENLPMIIDRLLHSVPTIHILIVDDNSPDGTGLIADNLSMKYDNINVIHNSEKNGLGYAYIVGFSWGIKNGFSIFIEMDADGSHKPEQLPLLLSAINKKNVDLVIGSRYIKGGEIINWPKYRLLLSYCGNMYIRALIGFKVKDSTSGFRVYTKNALHKINYTSVKSQGYSFQVELARRAYISDCNILEIPITFIERRVGKSKMNFAIIQESFRLITLWGIKDRIIQLKKLSRKKINLFS